MAEQVCRFLESHSLPCWVAPRDVTPGKNYGAAIVDAIDECSVFLLILSSASNKSGQVVREVERAASSNSTIIPFRVEDVHPSRDLEFYVSSTHWLDAVTRPLDQHLRELLKAIKNWQQSKKEAAGQAPPSSAPPLPPPTPLPAAPTRKSPSSAGVLGGIIAALLLCALLAFWLLRPGKTSPAAPAAQPSPTVTATPVSSETPPPTAIPVTTLPASTPNEPVASPPPPVPMTPPPIRRRPGELFHSPAPARTAAAPSPTSARRRPGQALASPVTPPRP